MIQRVVCVLLFLIAAGVVSPSAEAQIPSFSVEGKVTTKDGSPVEGAEIAAVPGKEARGERKVKTKADGRYRIPFVEYGTYRFRASRDGLVMYAMSVKVQYPKNTVELEQKGDVGPEQTVPQFEIGPQRLVVADFVMVPKDFFEKPLSGQAAGPGTGGLVTDANRLTQEKKFAESDALLKKVLEKENDNAAAYYLMGLNSSGLGRKEEAAGFFEKAYSIDPKQAGVSAQLGLLAYEKADKAKAAEWFRKELEVSPAAVPVMLNLAMALQETGQKEEAAAQFERVIALSPSESGAYLDLAALYTELGRQEKAADVLKRMEQVAKPTAAHWFNIGAGFFNSDDLDKAEMAFKKALDLDPQFPEANLQMGYVKVKKGDTAEAVRYLEAYLRVKPNAPDAAEVRATLEALRSEGRK